MIFLKHREDDNPIIINFLINDEKIDEINSSNVNFLKDIDFISNKCKFKIYVFRDMQKQGVDISFYADSLKIDKPINSITGFTPQYLFAVTSSFFDKNVNYERTSILLPSNDELMQADLFSELPSNDYQNDLINICHEFIKNNEPDLIQKKNAVIKELEKQHGYINFSSLKNNDSLFFDQQEIIKNYRNKRNTEEDNLTTLIKQPNIAIEVLAKKVTEQNKHNLAKYIFYRNLIANKGLELTNAQEQEQALHNLFFKQKASFEQNNNNINNYLYQNCIWLLDDKFMSFAYCASDITINKIIGEIGNKKIKGISNKRPDIFILYNNPEDSNSYKDVVLIEFKKGNVDYKEKTIAIDQIDEYKQLLTKDIKGINNFYCYVICDFDDNDENLKRVMINRNFIKVFSNHGCMYYGYLHGSKTHITFLKSSSIFKDAVERNKTFLNLLIK